MAFRLNLGFSLLIGIVLISCKPAPGRTGEITSKKPNIVIIYLDDLGYGDLSSYGAKALSTPNIDRLANEGVRFTNGFATSST